MTYPNAHAGVKKLFTAEILSLIAAFCTIMAVVFVYFMTKSVDSTGQITSEGAAVTSFGGAAIFSMGASVLAIIAFIFRIIGIKKASADEDGFKVAFYLVLAGIVLALINAVIGSFVKSSVVTGIFSVLGDVIDLAITIYVIQGIRNLAYKLNNEDMDNKGKNIFKIILAVYILIIIAQIITLIAGGTSAGIVIAGVFGIVAGVLTIVQYVLYLGYLNKAKAMLAE